MLDQEQFSRIARVAALLVTRARAQNPVRITHQAIAAELGSSREVITRLLEDFAARGIIRSGRGETEILDVQALQSYAAV